jgi:hypothetical protein
MHSPNLSYEEGSSLGMVWIFGFIPTPFPSYGHAWEKNK